MSNSFLYGGEPPLSKSKFNLKRPNILKNISILKTTPENKINTLNNKERALWKWANVENLDVFLQDVYDYYLGNGFTCIVLEKALNIITLIFVVYISTYLGYCIDYSHISTSKRLEDIKIDQCYNNNITGFIKVLLWLFYIFIFLKMAQLYFDVKNLTDIHNFYNYLLNVSDNELQTIPWQNIIEQIMFLKDQNALTSNVVAMKAKNRIDAHDVANRIMRKDNYLIALYNSEVLYLSLPIPLFRTNILTKTLEWNINLCITGFVFNESGFVKQMFLKESQRQYLSEELRKRFMLAGVLNIILSPFLVTYFILLYFFRYFNEYKTSPGSLSARQYTPMAEWKFREYNELYHIFKKRLGLSMNVANKYIDQFPKEKTNLILKFVAFLSGSFIAILATLTLVDSENFINFEITNDKSVVFFFTIFGAIWTVSRNAVSQEYNTFNPEETVRELASYTHYLPKEWKNAYHTEEVKNDFCKLYNLRIVILLRELTSLVLTPFVLWFALPRSAENIVDFFREASTYVDGLGYVCKYAMFENVKDVQIDTSNKQGTGIQVPGPIYEHTNGKDNIDLEDVGNEEEDDETVNNAKNKMMQSYMYFIEDYENSENMVGKYQLPSRNDAAIDGPLMMNNNYSWKKQFQPGQNPELFRIGNHTLNDNNRGTSTSRRKGKSSGRRNGQLGTGSNNELVGSFINTEGFLRQHDSPDNGSHILGSALRQNANDTNNGGVLGLVKEYYKRSDVGR
ncbi:autophagy protein ATG9 NDAI_0A02040 [Naumovozyma dairenensis CBS 421]|uniref:Autophagy-related protein 9 n=1 Tax=Naumovozyma dairenensis (strain ATCC 10597 / BCRC 20456 / CBS 421 / NBRC 0211 / NRRL Y-12639) TaxID=1071378 RepID=G0W3H4_NAUDC|nr:hypothetical protein NDAI_0A02040 [Naumovozyma dairenensis CBS 421]CCD22362.1 hypothetical protein NDAI_0A02040 [Naumovozyma dairenensis CBS 421]